VTLSELIAQMRLSAGSATAVVGDDWMQGRSLFGGMQAVVALAAMRTLVSADVPLRTLQMTFIAPIAAGEVAARARTLRSGKSATHVEARIENAGELLAHAIGVFGVARNSVVQRKLPPSPAKTSAGKTLPYIGGMMPSFMQQFQVVLVDGALPFSNAPVSHTDYELSMREQGTATEYHLLAIADFVPPVALAWMPKPVPGSSLTWMLEIVDPDFTAQPLAGWRAASEMTSARDSYTSQTTTIFAPDGRAIALSRQSMVVFA
jgi:acyl-CoA thioesterase